MSNFDQIDGWKSCQKNNTSMLFSMESSERHLIMIEAK